MTAQTNFRALRAPFLSFQNVFSFVLEKVVKNSPLKAFFDTPLEVLKKSHEKFTFGLAVDRWRLQSKIPEKANIYDFLIPGTSSRPRSSDLHR